MTQTHFSSQGLAAKHSKRVVHMILFAVARDIARKVLSGQLQPVSKPIKKDKKQGRK